LFQITRYYTFDVDVDNIGLHPDDYFRSGFGDSHGHNFFINAMLYHYATTDCPENPYFNLSDKEIIERLEQLKFQFRPLHDAIMSKWPKDWPYNLQYDDMTPIPHDYEVEKEAGEMAISRMMLTNTYICRYLEKEEALQTIDYLSNYDFIYNANCELAGYFKTHRRRMETIDEIHSIRHVFNEIRYFEILVKEKIENLKGRGILPSFAFVPSIEWENDELHSCLPWNDFEPRTRDCLILKLRELAEEIKSDSQVGIGGKDGSGKSNGATEICRMINGAVGAGCFHRLPTKEEISQEFGITVTKPPYYKGLSHNPCCSETSLKNGVLKEEEPHHSRKEFRYYQKIYKVKKGW